jgi:DNA polymerase-3 subunit delta'
VTEVLEQLLVERHIATDSKQAKLLAAECRGSLERARELVDPAWWEMQQWLPPHLAPTRWDSYRLAERINEFVNQAGTAADARRQRLRAVFQMVAAHFRGVLHNACQAGFAQDETPSEVSRQTLELGTFAQQCAISALDRCLEAEVELDRNANQATLLECWLDDLSLLVRTPAGGALV